MCRSDRVRIATFFHPPAVRRGVCALVMCLVPGCVQEMANQPRYRPLQPSAAFDDGMASRSPVPGTVARGQLQLDDAYFTGKKNGQLVGELPSRALDGRTMEELLARGRERFGVFCSHCHGQVGGGTGGAPEYAAWVGMVVMRGFPAPPTYHQDRLRQMPLGHFFDVITNGFGRMPAHGTLVPPDDRWAIAAYIRALQLSQNAQRDELSTDDLKQLDTAMATPQEAQITVGVHGADDRPFSRKEIVRLSGFSTCVGFGQIEKDPSPRCARPAPAATAGEREVPLLTGYRHGTPTESRKTSKDGEEETGRVHQVTKKRSSRSVRVAGIGRLPSGAGAPRLSHPPNRDP